jgi:REP element-mobilizing transposase RayT
MKPPKGHIQLRKGRVSQIGQYYFITTTVKNGEKSFLHPDTVHIVLDTLKWLDEQRRIKLIAAVVMPDHLHFIAELKSGTLPELMKTLKGYTAREINKLLGRQGPLWQREYHDHGIRKEEGLMKVVKYCLENPVREGIVDDFKQYPYWFCIYDL